MAANPNDLFKSIPTGLDVPRAPTISEQIEQAAADKRQRLEERLSGAANTLREHERSRQLIADNPGWDLGTGNDEVRELTGGAVKGTGLALRGIGYAGEMLAGNNIISDALQASGQAMEDRGRQVQDAQSVAGLNLRARNQFSGDLTDPSTWDLGYDSSISGSLKALVPVIGELAPQIAAAFIKGIPGLAASITTGIAQTGMSQGDEAYDFVANSSIEDLEASSPVFNLEKEKGMSDEEARLSTAEKAKTVAYLAASPSGFVGAALGRLIWRAPFQKGASDSILRATGGSLVAGGLVEGAEEVSQSAGARMATNEFIGTDRDVMENSFANFTLGFGAGGMVSGASGATGAIGRKKDKYIDKIKSSLNGTGQSVADITGLNEEQMADQTATITQILQNNENMDDIIARDGTTKYDDHILAATLASVATDEQATDAQQANAKKGIGRLQARVDKEIALAELMLENGEAKGVVLSGLRESEFFVEMLQNSLKDVEGDVEATKQIQEKLDVQLSEVARLTEEAKTASTDLDPKQKKKLEQTVAKNRKTLQSFNQATTAVTAAQTPKQAAKTQEAVSIASDPNQTVEEREKAAEQVMSAVAANPNAVTTEQLKGMLFSPEVDSDATSDVDPEAETEATSGETTGLSAKTVSHIEAAIATKEQAEAADSTVSDVENGNELDSQQGFASVSEIRNRISTALASDNEADARRSLGKLENYAKEKNNKAAAAREAVDRAKAEGIPYAIVKRTTDANGELLPVGEHWQVRKVGEAGLSNKAIKKDPYALRFASDHEAQARGNNKRSLLDNIQAEADYVQGNYTLFSAEVESGAKKLSAVRGGDAGASIEGYQNSRDSDNLAAQADVSNYLKADGTIDINRLLAQMLANTGGVVTNENMNGVLMMGVLQQMQITNERMMQMSNDSASGGMSNITRKGFKKPQGDNMAPHGWYYNKKKKLWFARQYPNNKKSKSNKSVTKVVADIKPLEVEEHGKQLEASESDLSGIEALTDIESPVTLPETEEAVEGDQVIANKANKIIANPAEGSAVESYVEAYGDNANGTEYVESDVVFLAGTAQVEGRGNKGYSKNKIFEAMREGVTFVTRPYAEREKAQNRVDKNIAKFLTKYGYTENTAGVWTAIDAEKTKAALNKTATVTTGGKKTKSKKPTVGYTPLAVEDQGQQIDSPELDTDGISSMPPQETPIELPEHENATEFFDGLAVLAANKFVGTGAEGSVTAAYATAYGENANPEQFNEDDVVFITADETSVTDGKSFDIEKVYDVMRAGATIITRPALYRNDPMRTREKSLANSLAKRGYTEVEQGVWKPLDAEKTKKALVKTEQAPAKKTDGKSNTKTKTKPVSLDNPKKLDKQYYGEQLEESFTDEFLESLPDSKDAELIQNALDSADYQLEPSQVNLLSKATAFIGKGEASSLTANLSELAEVGNASVNPGQYTADDVVYVTADQGEGTGNKKTGRPKEGTNYDIKEIRTAMQAGATIIMQPGRERNKPENMRLNSISKVLVATGYTESANGIWTPIDAARTASLFTETESDGDSNKETSSDPEDPLPAGIVTQGTLKDQNVVDNPPNHKTAYAALHALYVDAGKLQDVRRKRQLSENEQKQFAALQHDIELVSGALFKAQSIEPLNELVELINTPEGATTASVVDWIQEHGNEYAKDIITQYAEHSAIQNLKNITFGVSNNVEKLANVWGAYDPESKTVRITPKTLESFSKDKAIDYVVKLLLHEFSHPIENAILTDPNNPITKELNRVKSVLSQWVDNNQSTVDQLDRPLSKALDYIMNDANGVLEINPTLVQHPELYEILNNISDPDAPRKRSILQSLVNALVSALSSTFNFNRREQTLLKSILQVQTELLTAAPEIVPTPTAPETTPKTREERIALLPKAAQNVIEGTAKFLHLENAASNIVGPLTSAMKGQSTFNSYFISGRRTPLSYSSDFYSDVLPAALNDINVLKPYMTQNGVDFNTLISRGDPQQYLREMQNFNEFAKRRMTTLYRTLENKDYMETQPLAEFEIDGELDPKIVDVLSTAAFMFTTEQIEGMFYNTDDQQIRSLFNIPNEVQVPASLKKRGTTLGVREASAAASVGKIAVKLLDLRVRKGAKTPKNKQPQLELAMGRMALALMEEKGYVQTLDKPGTDVNYQITELMDELRSKKIKVDLQTLRTPKLLEAFIEENENHIHEDMRPMLRQAAAERHTFMRVNRWASPEIKDAAVAMQIQGNWPKDIYDLNDEAILSLIDKTHMEAAQRESMQQNFRQVIKSDGKMSNKNILYLPLQRLLNKTADGVGFANALFLPDSQRVLPHTDPEKAGYKKGLKNNSNIETTEYVSELLDKAAKIPHQFQTDLFNTDENSLGIINRFMANDELYLAKVFGWEMPGKMHVDREADKEAVNANYLRQAELVIEHNERVLEGDSTKSWFYNYVPWGNDRVGIDSKGFNAQMHLGHRALSTNPDWASTIDPANNNDFRTQMFKLALLQGLEVSTDKMNPTSALQQWDAITQDKNIRPAVATFKKMLNDVDYVPSVKEAQAIIEIARSIEPVSAKDMGRHFRALFELARFERAKERGESFVSDISAETDGRTNGPILGLIQFGSAAADIDTLLEMGGIYTDDSKYTDSLNYIQEQKQDIYKYTGRGALAEIAEIEEELANSSDTKSDKALARLKRRKTLVNRVMGDLTEDNDQNAITAIINGTFRQLVKEPVTANFYMAGENSLKNTMGVQMVEAYYLKIEALELGTVKGLSKKQRQAAIDDIVELINKGVYVDYRKNEDPDKVYLTPDENGSYLTKPLTARQRESLHKAMAETYGAATYRAIRRLFETSKETSGNLLNASQMAMGFYRALRNAERRRLITQKHRELLAANQNLHLPNMEWDKVGSARITYTPSLSLEEEQAIDEKLAEAMPLIHSYQSMQDGDVGNGISPFKRQLSTEANDTISELHDMALGEKSGMPPVLTGLWVKQTFGKKGVRKLEHALKTIREDGTKGPRKGGAVLKAVLNDYLGYGVGAIAKGIHSSDSAIAMQVYTAMAIINAHDGFTGGSAMTGESARMANEALMMVYETYSLPEQIVASTMQTLDYIERHKAEYADDVQFYLDLNNAIPIEKDEENKPLAKQTWSPYEFMARVIDNAGQAHTARLETMSRWAYVDQYAYPGSSVKVEQAWKDRMAERARTEDFNALVNAKRAEDAKALPTLHTEKYNTGSDRKAFLDLAAGTLTPEGQRVKAVAVSQEARIQDRIDRQALIAASETRTVIKPVNRNLGKKQIQMLIQISDALGHADNDYSITKTVTSLFPKDTKADQSKRDEYIGGLTHQQSTLIQRFENTKAAAPYLDRLNNLKEWKSAYDAKDSSIGKLYAPEVDEIGPITYTTEEIMDALSERHNLTPQRNKYLKQLLKEITNNLFSGTGALPSLTISDMGLSARELAARHTVENIGPFSSRAASIGLNLNPAEAFTLEQIELSVQGALNAGTIADTELNRLFNGIKKEFNADGRDFYLNAEGQPATIAQWKNATITEKEQAKAQYQLIFEPSSLPGNTQSSHLSRFTALALVYEPMQAKINDQDFFNDSLDTNEQSGKLLYNAYNKLMRNMGNSYYGIKQNSPTVEVIQQIARRLALNEHRRRIDLAREINKPIQSAENLAQQGLDKSIELINSAANSDAIRKSSVELVRNLGAITRTVAQDRADEVIKIIEAWHDETHPNRRLGIVRSLITDVRGETPENRHIHALNAQAKNIESERKKKDEILGDEILSNFANPEKLTEGVSGAVTQLYVRSDAGALLDYGYSVNDIHAMVTDGAARKARILKLSKQLIAYSHGHDMVYDSHDLGYHMATGFNISRVLYQNADLIALQPQQKNNRAAIERNAQTVRPLIDQLATLAAIEYTPYRYKHAALPLINEEKMRGTSDAFSYILRQHNSLSKKAEPALFDGKKLLMKKGYVRETYSPHNTYEMTANTARMEVLLKKGYTEVGVSGIANDKAHKLFVNRGVGLPDYETGAMLNVQTSASGHQLYQQTGSVDSPVLDSVEKKRRKNHTRYEKIRQGRERAEFNPLTYRADTQGRAQLMNQRIAKSEEHTIAHLSRMAPVVNGDGEIVNWRWMANHHTLDTVMERDNRVETVLGRTLGSNYNKEASNAHNDKVIEALAKYSRARPLGMTSDSDYVEISPTHPDPQIQEIYRLFSEDTKRSIVKHFGSATMRLPNTLVETVLGYRHLTTDNVLQSAYEKISRFAGVEAVGQLLGPKAAMRVRRTHDWVVESMHMLRNTVVIRNFYTLYDNIRSNMVTLYQHKVPLKDIVKGHHRAFKALNTFQDDSAELLKAELRLDVETDPARRKVIETRIKELNFNLERNPAKSLIDKGMYQTIQDDVDLDKQRSKYQTPFEQQIAAVSDRLPESVRKFGEFALVSQNSKLYKFMAKATQSSDFVGRFILYEHMQNTQAKLPESQRLSEEEMDSQLRESFINYHTPQNQKIQYLNDIGLLRFSKYFTRVQKQILQRFAKAPAQTIAVIVGNRLYEAAGGDAVPNIMDSSAIGRIGNPFQKSVFDIPGLWNEPIPINLITN